METSSPTPLPKTPNEFIQTALDRIDYVNESASVKLIVVGGSTEWNETPMEPGRVDFTRLEVRSEFTVGVPWFFHPASPGMNVSLASLAWVMELACQFTNRFHDYFQYRLESPDWKTWAITAECRENAGIFAIESKKFLALCRGEMPPVSVLKDLLS